MKNDKNMVSLDALSKFKPLVKWSSKGIVTLFLIMGLIAVALGGYLGFFRDRGYLETSAVITKIDEEADATSDDPDAKTYTATVSYTVDGKDYVTKLGDWDPSYKLDKRITIKYDPENPEKISGGGALFGVVFILIGAALIAFALFSLIKNKKQLSEYKEKQNAPVFTEPGRSGDERELFFLTDLGTAKGGCHIEDPDRRVLYEADATDFSLISDSEYTFTDHENGRSRKFLVSKTVTSSSDAPWVLDNHSTFSLNGEDVWKSLHENGIEIETGLSGLKWSYEIYRDGVQVAHIESSGRLVHEEDAEKGGMLSGVPSQGFFRIWTDEKDLSAVFLCCFAIGRTDMMIYS